MVTQRTLKKILRYDEVVGEFFWAEDRPYRRRTGDRAGSRHSKTGYVYIRFDGRSYLAHRLAWLYLYGKIPPAVDHINGNPSDNRIANLRAVTASLNAANSKRRITNRSGYKGVSFNHNLQRWQAGIKVNGRSFHLGLFQAPEEAHAAYVEAAAKYFGEYVRTA